jgi:N-acetylglutamate synthase-like GNAT family acetyltransferase
MSITIQQIAFASPEWADATALRRAVLRIPLGLDYSPTDLAAEFGDTLFAAYEDRRVVGVVMLRPDGPGVGKLRQMAVAKGMRGRRIGEQLVTALEAHARSLGIRRIGLASREVAVGFYERLGYTADGPQFTEVTLPHRHMSKAI